MNIYVHYCLYGFSNCYIVGADDSADPAAPRNALIVDPGCIDEKLVEFIEKNDYTVRAILITHDHDNHVHGLKTFKKIYNAEVFAVDPTVCEQRATLVHDGDILDLAPFSVEVFSVPGHSADSAVFRIERVLFTGDVMSAGLVGTTASSYGRAVQSAAIRSKLLSLPGDFVIMAGHGPPSTLEAERRFNAGLEASERAGAQRAAFVRDIW